MKVFIDGENMRHRLVSALTSVHKIHDSEEYFSADIRRLIIKVLAREPEHISYYTTRIHQPDFEIPERLRDEITGIQEQHRRWIAELTNQGITIVKAGNLKIHENAPCYHCGRRTMVLQEKGVDVRLASEMVMAAVHDHENEIVLLSSDADMIPAIEIARRAGARVMYLCYEEEENEALKRATDQTLTYSRQDVMDVFKPYAKEHHGQRN